MQYLMLMAKWPIMPYHKPFQNIACQQVMAENGSIFSVQWTDLPATTDGVPSAEELLYRYLKCVRKWTLTLVRPEILESGIEFRLLGSRRSLISFLPPSYADGFATLSICGGLLVQPHQRIRDDFRFGIEYLSETVRVSLQLSDFHPLILGNSRPPVPIRFWLYRASQAAIHRLLTIRFLAKLYHELAGPSAGVRVINVAVRTGKPV